MHKRAFMNLKKVRPKTKRRLPLPTKSIITHSNTAAMSPSGVLQLQRMVGNRATTQLLERKTAQAPTIQRRANDLVEDEKLPCPGSKIKSKGLGRGKGYGRGKGPVGVPRDKKDV